MPAGYKHTNREKVCVRFALALSLVFLFQSIVSEVMAQSASASVYSSSVEKRWVDSIAHELSLKEKVAQLMMVRVPTKMNTRQRKSFERLVSKEGVGGICFFSGTCSAQAQATKRYQKLADVPLLVAIDGEWGLGMRLSDAYSFPRQMMMGALQEADDSIIFSIASEIGRQCKMMGIHVNFAPVVDLNSNPANPVIGARSFGEDKVRVAHKSVLFVKGIQSQGVMAVAKHFPGHGDTESDSHIDLPVINHSREYIDSVDTYPFRAVIEEGCGGVMVAHLQIKSLDTTNVPSSLSGKVVNEYLRRQLHFNGLIFTDGMDMGAITKHYPSGEAEAKAFLAGADVLLLPSDVEVAIDAIVAMARKDASVRALVEEKCRRVLVAKYRYVISNATGRIVVPAAEDKLRSSRLASNLAAAALTPVRTSAGMWPLQSADNVLWLTVGNGTTAISALSPSVEASIAKADKVVIELNAYANPTSAGNYGVSNDLVKLVNDIALLNPKTALVVYGSPYILKYWPRDSVFGPRNIVIAYQNLAETHAAFREEAYRLHNEESKEGTSEVSRTQFRGMLPVTVGGYNEGQEVKLSAEEIDHYHAIRARGWDVSCFERIDSIALGGIAAQAYPGCRLVVLKDGETVYDRSYGRQTYEISSPSVNSSTVYDLASVTKVASTTIAVMKLVDEGKIKLDDKLSRYLPYLKHTDKSRITIKQALSHCAGLKAFDAYWKNVDSMCSELSSRTYVDANLSCQDCRNQVLEQIVKSKLGKKQKYVYSDLGFILLADMVEKVSGQSLDIFMKNHFYEPMGLRSMTFRPLVAGVDSSLIAPTEQDNYYRHRLLRGEVHDQNAAAMGGVAGHAGLFSTATDLSKLCEMLLNGGVCDGKRYLSEAVITQFNHQYFSKNGNRRALGFDKPLSPPRSTTARQVSPQSYGHTGFTGTMLWIDPAYNLVYVFLSNRVHPSATPNKLAQMNIRTEIQELIYKSFLK